LSPLGAAATSSSSSAAGAGALDFFEAFLVFFLGSVGDSSPVASLYQVPSSVSYQSSGKKLWKISARVPFSAQAHYEGDFSEFVPANAGTCVRRAVDTAAAPARRKARRICAPSRAADMLTAAGAATARALARREGAAARLPENADAGSACELRRRRVSCGAPLAPATRGRWRPRG
jgi:hypothetical protein